MINLSKLFKYLDSLGVTYLETWGEVKQHWILPDNLKRRKAEILRNVFSYLGKSEVRYSHYVIKRNRKVYCGNTNCIHPDCHKIVFTGVEIKNDTFEEVFTEEDVMDYAQEINLDDYYRMGKKLFLEKFNETQPEFLKINEKKLDIIINYMEDNREKI